MADVLENGKCDKTEITIDNVCSRQTKETGLEKVCVSLQVTNDY